MFNKNKLTTPFQNLKTLLLSLLLLFTTSQAHSLSVTLTERQLCDLEMLIVDGFAPLKGFNTQKDYERIVSHLRLSNGNIWPIPIVLDIDESLSDQIAIGDTLNLENKEGLTLAILNVTDQWRPNKRLEAINVYGTTDKAHPGVAYLFEQTKNVYIGGPITPVNPPVHYDFTDLRKTPKELKAYFAERGIEQVVGFQTRNPMHRAHVAITKIAMEETGAHLLIQPVVGQTKPGDIGSSARVRCYRKILNHYPENSTSLSVLPLAMRMAGPREALWHALIRKNYGCTHFIVGRDHAGPGVDSFGNPFYGPYEAQDLVKRFSRKIGIELVPFPEVVYVKEKEIYLPRTELEPGMTELKISGTEFRRRLQLGLEIPSWLSYPEIIEELRRISPPRSRQGITLFFTGFSGAGKSTIASALSAKLSELQYRPITILDGDYIRKNLSSKLGFSAEDRSANVRRVGFVANEITKNGGLAICALIAPYASDREHNRALINGGGRYIEIHIATPIHVCAARDVKGLYAKVQKGIIKNFTGIDDPYEAPKNPELEIDTTDLTIAEAVEEIVNFLRTEGYLPEEA
ncbi:MAG: putative bifunctional SAT/APS kinase [Chlamydiae bacterium]|nr:putative bifunctional SAT/APS kinase [Chlamydiota bacterium]